MSHCLNSAIFVHRKVFLGQKKGKDDQLYAIKVMKKADMVNKNMVNQGMLSTLISGIEEN